MGNVTIDESIIDESISDDMFWYLLTSLTVLFFCGRDKSVSIYEKGDDLGFRLMVRYNYCGCSRMTSYYKKKSFTLGSHVIELNELDRSHNKSNCNRYQSLLSNRKLY